MVAVPDMLALCKIYADAATTQYERFLAMRAIYGGHSDEFDMHHTGFDETSLRSMLTEMGFAHIQRVVDFGFADDCSSLALCGVDISLNMVAHKPY